jgi:ABC-2 type transport system permease protein
VFFRSIYLKTFRDLRVPILGWGFGFGILMLVVVAAIQTVIATPQARAALLALGPSFAWFAEPVKIDTPGGYATWKYGLTVLIVALWPILSEGRMLRGDEERGVLDVLLSMPRGRVRVAVEKVAAMWTALLAMAVLVGVLAYIGAAKVKADFGLGDAILFGLNLAVISAVFGAISLLISQFTQERRTAAGATSGVLLVFIVMDMVHRVVPNTEWLSRLSPVYYYNLSKPLVPSYGTNFGAMLLMAALTVILSGVAIWLFARRDIAGVVALPRFLRLPHRAARPQGELLEGGWSLQSVFARSLAMVAWPTAWWTLAIAGFAAWMVIVVQQIAAQLNSILNSSPLMKSIFKLGGSGGATDAAILSSLFFFLPLLLMAFAVTQASRWAADEEDGRLELVLATPQSRLKVLLARFAALSTAAIVISVVTLAASAIVSAASGVQLDRGNLAAATLSMIPLGLLVAALGYLFSGWLRAALDTGLLSFLLVIWFVISFIGPGLSWPSATLKLSALYYYGTPLLNGWPIGDTLVVVAAAAVALALASLRFVRKDIAV